MVALALPLAPLAPGAAAAAGTFVIGSAAYIAQQVHGFRAPLPAPMIPRTGGKAGGATMKEMVADAIAGARIPVALPPNPFGPRGSIGLVGLLAAAGFIRRGASQAWGWFGSRPATESKPDVAPVFKGKKPAPENTVPGLLGWRTLAGSYLGFLSDGGSGCARNPNPPSSQAQTAWQYKAGVIDVQTYTNTGRCGPISYRFRYTTDGTTWTDVPLASTTYGWQVFSSGYELSFDGPAVDVVSPDYSLPLPDGYRPPRPSDPVPAVAPKKLPPAVSPPKPLPQPEPEPEPKRSPVPVEPGPSRPVVVPVRVPSTAPKAPPVPARVIVVRPDGKLPAPARDPVAVTHPDAHYPIPGKGPIVGNGPQVKPEEIAKELGRIEEKLNRMLDPVPDTGPEWGELLKELADKIKNELKGTKYKIKEKCPPCDGGEYSPKEFEVEAKGADNAFDVIINRIDALAKLIDEQLGLKQQICPPCKPTVRGELVTINFQSDPAEVPSRYAIKKHLSYRDQSGRDEEFHLQHWKGFSWDTGAAIVTSKGLPWGIVKVWAVDNAEGQRVIAHAATAAGVNLDDPKHEWVFATTDHPRYGRQGTVWPVKWDETGKLMISKRGGPSGLPGYKRDS